MSTSTEHRLVINRVRGKMRFWSKTKHGEKKLSREKQASMSDAGELRGKKKNSFLRICSCVSCPQTSLSVSSSLLQQRALLLLAVQTWRPFLPGPSRTVRRTRSCPRR